MSLEAQLRRFVERGIATQRYVDRILDNNRAGRPRESKNATAPRSPRCRDCGGAVRTIYVRGRWPQLRLVAIGTLCLDCGNPPLRFPVELPE